MVSVTCWVALAVFNCCAAKFRLSGASASVAGSTAVPLSEAVCVPALSATLKLPGRVPGAVGWNVTDTVHPEPAPSVDPQVSAVIVKSPVTTGVCKVAATPPVFEIVIFCAALTDPTFVAEYVTVVGVNTIAAPAAPTPASAGTSRRAPGSASPP